MSAILDLRAGIVAAGNALRDEGERFHGVKFHTHGGEFDDLAELERYAQKAPCVFVSILRTKVDTDYVGGETWATCTVGLFALAKNEPALKRDSGALALADNLMEWVANKFPRPTWGLPATGKIEDIVSRNLYHPKLDDKGIAIWAVLFAQGVKLEPPVATEYVDLRTVHADWDLHPRDNDAELEDVIDAEDDIILYTPEPGALVFDDPTNSFLISVF